MYGACGGVVGEHAGEEQREVAETPVDARSVGLGNAVEHGRQPCRVKLTEPLPAPATPALRPHRPAHHPRVRSEVLDHEVAAGGVDAELAQLLGVEYGDAHARRDPLLDERGTPER